MTCKFGENMQLGPDTAIRRTERKSLQN